MRAASKVFDGREFGGSPAWERLDADLQRWNSSVSFIGKAEREVRKGSVVELGSGASVRIFSAYTHDRREGEGEV